MRFGRRSLVLLATAAFALAGCASTEPDTYSSSYDELANAPADVSYFYDALAPYGEWVQLPPYGWAWCPYDTPVGWRPYSVGYWTDTDNGWMWISDDPWGWAPYHYGRWAFNTTYGWIWIPGDVWAPAWVAWRYGDGWVGWAPLPPEVGWQAGVGLDLTSYDLDQGIAPDRWSFVHDRDLLNTRVRTRVLPLSKNVTLVRVTKNVTNYAVLQDRPVDRGVDPQLIHSVVGRPIPRYRVIEAQAPDRDRAAVIRGDQISVYRPAVTGRAQGGNPRPLPPVRGKVQSPDAVLKRQDAERQGFDATMQRERARLQQEQQQELQHPPSGVSADELRRQQQEELSAQKDREARERQTLEKRSEILRQAIEQRRKQQQQLKDQKRQQQEQQKQERQRAQEQKRQQQEEQKQERERQKDQRQRGSGGDQGGGDTRDR